jgi:RND family efflux transporter MFP subunit
MIASYIRQKWVWVALFLSLAFGGAVWLYHKGRLAVEMAEPSAARRLDRPIPVRTVQVAQERVEVVIGGTATTVASKTATIQFGVTGTSGEPNPTIKAVHVKDGDFVSRDKVLIEVEDAIFRNNLKQRLDALEAARAELKHAEAGLSEKAKLRQASLEAAKADLKHAQAGLTERAKFRQASLDAAKADLKHAQAGMAEKGKLRQAALDAATSDLKHAQAALTERAKARKLAVTESETELLRATKALEEKAEIRKLHLESAEAEVKFIAADLDIALQHIEDVKKHYKKENDSKASEIYYHALSQYEKTRAVLSKAKRDLQQAKSDMHLLPLADQASVAKAEKTLEHAKNDVILGLLLDQEAVAKAKKGLQQAANDMAVGPLADEEAVAKATKALQQATNDMFLGPLADEEAVAKAKKGLQQATNDMLLGALSDEDAVTKAQSSLATAQGHLMTAQKELDSCRLKAPVDGLVDGLTLTPGMNIKQHAPLAQILQIDPIYVKMDFPQERLGEVALGQQAEVVLDSFPTETFKGTVAQIGAHLDTHLRVLPVYIKLANSKHRLRPGVSGFARIRSSKMAVVVPAAAVIGHESKTMVFRVEQGRARIREVRTGSTAQTGFVEIASGLAPGDEIVIYSNFYNGAGYLTLTEGYLQDNDRVDADWRRWARRDD